MREGLRRWPMCLQKTRVFVELCDLAILVDSKWDFKTDNEIVILRSV